MQIGISFESLQHCRVAPDRRSSKILLHSCAALFSVLNRETPEGLPLALGRWRARIGWQFSLFVFMFLLDQNQREKEIR